MGRPKKKIDPDEVIRLARLGCTQNEIAEWFGCDQSTISKRFSSVFRLGKAGMKISLRRWQLKRARAGSDVMLVHLGKHYLGQQDRNQNPQGLDEPNPLDDQGREIPRPEV
jgi:hypothetical protein